MCYAEAERGTLAGSPYSSISSHTRRQDFGLEALGNWKEFKDDAGDGSTWDLDQDRTHNAVNETTGITGGSWIVPGYDAAGNMLSGPSPLDPTVRHHYKWDAWNRLVAVYADDNNEPGDLIAEYRYDAFNRRIAKIKPDPAHSGKYVRTDYYYTPSWQIAQVRENDNLDSKETIATARKYEYIWDVRYIDAPVCRDENKNADNDCTDSGGSERLYYTQDANFNVTALVGTDGTVAERYVYDPYGKRTIWEPDWSDEISWANSKKNEILFTGHRLNPESGLYYAGARYYDPVLGRWISWDPSGYDDGMNLTEYAGGRPTVSRDALGLARTPDFKGALMKRIKRSDIDENRIHLLSGDSEKTCEDSSVGDVAKGVLTYTSEPHVLENARWLKWYIYRACKVEVSLTCKCAKYELPLLGWTIWTSYSWAGDEASVSVVSAMFVTVYEKYDVGLEERDVFDRLQGYEDTLHRGAEVGSNLESWVPIVINPLEGAAMMALDALVSEQVERVDLREFAGLKPKQRMVVRRLSGDEAKRECLGPIGLISGDSE